ncbi:MAG: ethanolamine ammonia-lyase subunit EutC [Pseudomonadota bacterium]
MTSPKPPVITNPWGQLRQFTDARIALGRTGASLPTQRQLAFQLAHAQARDAVHQALDVPQLLQDMEDAGLAKAAEACVLHSEVADRLEYLQRPDLGRRLDAPSRERLKAIALLQGSGCDIAVVIADGLSSLAVAQNAAPFLVALGSLLGDGVPTARPVIVQQGRVAIGDEIGEMLGARLVLLLIGERPGLSSPDSMGAYLTWAPRVGLTDASRNCVSNIRPAGLPWDEAAAKVHYLITQMQARQLSGVGLKDETVVAAVGKGMPHGNFLIGQS